MGKRGSGWEGKMGRKRLDVWKKRKRGREGVEGRVENEVLPKQKFTTTSLAICICTA